MVKTGSRCGCTTLKPSSVSSCLKSPVTSNRKFAANFGKLHPDSDCDNVLLEHILALEQEARGFMRAIFPVLVGTTKAIDADREDEHEVEEEQSLRSRRYVHGNFFTEGGLPKSDSGQPCTTNTIKAIDQRALHHLTRHSDVLRGREEYGACLPNSREDVSELKLERRSPFEVLEQVKRHQGFLLKGERSRMVTQCANGEPL
jgi:hypothetical protein